jgi:hypothetical protein
LPCRKKKNLWWELASLCCWNRARRLTCFLSAFVTRKCLQFIHEETPLSDTIDSVLRHRELGRAKDLSAPPRTHRERIFVEENCRQYIQTKYLSEQELRLSKSVVCFVTWDVSIVGCYAVQTGK